MRRVPAVSRSCAGRPRSRPRLEDKRCVAISGTHGKTTTTSLLTVGAQACGVDPSFAIGGNLYETGRNAHLGSGELAIVEADESDGSFLLTRPVAAIVTNVEADHLENHGDLEGIFRAFEQFVDRVDADGLLLVCADDAGAARIADYAARTGRRVLTYGERDDADVLVTQIDALPDAVEFTVTSGALGPPACPRRCPDRAAHGVERRCGAGDGGRTGARRGHCRAGLGHLPRRASPIRTARLRRRRPGVRRLRTPSDRDRCIADSGTGSGRPTVPG